MIPHRPPGTSAARLTGSFQAAFAGLRFIVETQQNWRIHLVVAAVAVAGAWFFGLSLVEWAVIVAMMGLVLGMEAANTAIEAAIDASPGPWTDHTRHAKDAAAAAVLIAAMAALGVGVLLFGPRVLQLLRS